jgi:ribonuclease P protein component
LEFLLAFMLATESPVSRIGITVPRAAGKAVTRNLLKRRLREAVRRHLSELGPGWDIVLNVRQAAVNVTLAGMEEAIRKFFQTCQTSRPAASR